MFQALNVALEIGRGLGIVRPAGFFEQLEALLLRYASGAMGLFFKLLQYFFVAVALLTSASAIYALLYHIMMPIKLHEKTLYFNYGIDCGESPYPPCSPSPEATVDFLMKHNQWHATNLTRTESKGARILSPDRYYTVDLEFQVPDSEVNNQLGMWMVKVQLLTKDNRLIAQSLRPLLLQYRSRYVKMLLTFISAPLLALGLRTESQTLVVNFFDRFQESMDYPLGKARVSLSSRNLQVYSANLSITAQLNWLQYVMLHWFWTTAWIAVLFIASIEAIVIGFIYVWAQLSIEEEQVGQETGMQALQGSYLTGEAITAEDFQDPDLIVPDTPHEPEPKKEPPIEVIEIPRPESSTSETSTNNSTRDNTTLRYRGSRGGGGIKQEHLTDDDEPLLGSS